MVFVVEGVCVCWLDCGGVWVDVGVGGWGELVGEVVGVDVGCVVWCGGGVVVV